MKEEKTEKYSLYYPEDMNPEILGLFHEMFNLLIGTIKDLKDKKPTIAFCRNNKFVVNLTVVDRIAEFWRDIIAYNLEKIEQKDKSLWKIIILEELVHCYVDTLDERVAGLIVASLIPEIDFDVATMTYKAKK